ncbi:MAG TPA: glycosyltransferase family 4 protein [Rhodospirillales bacterium]
MPELGQEAGTATFPVLVIGDSGGPHVRSRALAMAWLGYEIHTVTPRPSGVVELNEIGPVASRFGNTPFLSLFNPAAALLDLWRRIRKSAGEIVHIHYASSLGAWLFVASGDRRPLIVSVMGGDILFDEQGDLSAPARWLTRQVLRRADFVTAKSEYLVDRLVALGVRRERIGKILWGVDTDLFRPASDGGGRKAAPGATGDGPMIFSPRILKRFYRTDVILSALPAVLARYPNARLIIAEYESDPVYKREIESLAHALEVAGSVAFAGVIPHERMPKFYNAADVVVGIPPSDAFPQTVLEAMACGRPNIVSRLSRYSEFLVDRESALFVDPTAEGVAAGIIELTQDRELAARISRNGVAIAREKAELAREAAKVSSIYQRLRRSQSRGPLPWAARAAAKAILCGLAARDALRAACCGWRTDGMALNDANTPLVSRSLKEGGAE